MIDQELYEWSEDDTQAFYTALDTLDDLLHSSGIPQNEIDDIFSIYFQQRRSGEVPPEKVLDRLINAGQKRLA